MGMIKITFQQIFDRDPCVEGWAKLLLNKGIIDQLTHDDWVDDDYVDMDGVILPTEPFPLADILDTNNLDDTLWCLRCLPEHDSLWRKYTVWCAYQVEHLMQDDRSKEALRVAWDYAEGEATLSQLNAASDAASDAARDAAWTAAWTAARDAAWTASARAAARDAARAKQEAKLRELLETETIECPWSDENE